ncbi:MAG: RNA polymerase sigma factor [Oscillospiraceae bacterium]|nr:RNA polymerase sigma factor [Oscillospiraceae bacterium]
MTDRELIRALNKGDVHALEELIDRYGKYVSSVVSRILSGRRQDCEELTEDVFLAAWENRHKLREDKLKGYLGAIARNKAFNRLRDLQEELPLEDDILFEDSDIPCDLAEKKDTARLIERALSQLEPQQKELFVRHYWYGQTVKEAANEMQVNFSTAKTWLARGREQLKEILIKEGYEL